MKIGIVPILDPNAGGIYQYSITMLDALSVLKQKEKKDEYYIFAPFIFHQKLQKYIDNGFIIQSLEPLSFYNLFKNIFKSIIGVNLSSYLYGLINNKDNHQIIKKDTINYNYSQKKWFDRFSIDLMIYPAPHIWSFETGIPYIMAVHDLQHRLHPQFPEVSEGGELEEREYLYSNGIKQATIILAESEVGKEDIIRFYDKDKRLNQNKIKILPYLPSFIDIKNNGEVEIKIREKFHLPSRFIFYPAAFWPHKNHLRIIKAIGVINEKFKCKVPIVFCGSYIGKYRKELYDEVRETAKKLSIETYYLDYVKDNDLIGLYAGAEALVMPTFFGPTNIPVLEAWVVGCPVITSDIRGIREQVGDAALLVNPSSVESIMEGIYKIWTDSGLRKRLIGNGRKNISKYNLSEYCAILSDAINDAKLMLKTRN